jgi:thioredoxin reductase
MSQSSNQSWDVVVVGGGAAGLSAALVLGRARRRTLLVDAGGQSNLAAAAVGGLLGHDGQPPAELYAGGRRELARYPTVELRDGEVIAGSARPGGGFELELDGGRPETARRVLLATGMEYRPPALPGIAERWGGSVFHCPFCHGWEVRERPLGVLDSGPEGARRALLLSAWSDEVTLFSDGPAGLGEKDARLLAGAGVDLDQRPVAGLRGPGAELAAVVFESGEERPCEGLQVAVTLHRRSDLAAKLGAVAADPNALTAEAVAVDQMGSTAVPGLSAVGDLGGGMPSVANAVAAGAKAAALIVHGLAEERAEAALRSGRPPAGG